MQTPGTSSSPPPSPPPAAEPGPSASPPVAKRLRVWPPPAGEEEGEDGAERDAREEERWDRCRELGAAVTRECAALVERGSFRAAGRFARRWFDEEMRVDLERMIASRAVGPCALRLLSLLLGGVRGRSRRLDALTASALLVLNDALGRDEGWGAEDPAVWAAVAEFMGRCAGHPSVSLQDRLGPALVRMWEAHGGARVAPVARAMRGFRAGAERPAVAAALARIYRECREEEEDS